jgi:transposase
MLRNAALGVSGHLAKIEYWRTSVSLKIYRYVYLNRIQSRRRLEREAKRNIELILPTNHVAPDFKTIDKCLAEQFSDW